MKFSDTLKYRSAWMGFAMLWVVFYHSSFFVDGMTFFKNTGYGGVDIFLFASGIGCYYSLCKDDDVLRFANRRVSRIFPTYWCFLPFWFVYAFKAFDMSVEDVIGNILGIQNFTTKGNFFNWYISAILLLYILAPYMKKLVDRFDSLFAQGIMVAVLVLLSVPFFKSNTLIITMTRLPIFYIGMIFAKRCTQKVSLDLTKLSAFIMVAVIGFFVLYTVFNDPTLKPLRWKYGLYWYPFILIAPGLCVALSAVMSLLEKSSMTKWIVAVLSFVGKYSFEIYLVHLLIYDSVTYMVNNHLIQRTDTVNVVSTLLIPVGCFVLVMITKLFTQVIPKMFKSLKGSE